MTFESSTALMDNAWRDLEKRGVKVTAEREPGWRWWQPGMDPMQARIQGRSQGRFVDMNRRQQSRLFCCAALAGRLELTRAVKCLANFINTCSAGCARMTCCHAHDMSVEL